MQRLLLLLLLISLKGFSQQQTFDVTDSMPVAINGLKAGYTIMDESEKEVGKKGDFSRYKIKFYLTNTGSEAKIMYKKPGFMGHIGPLSNIIALFKCNNATGARMTNKMASMELQPCKIEAVVEDQECGTGKVVRNNRLVEIGFWIKPGETVSKTYPMIVPLGQKPNVSVTFYPEPANQTGTIETNEPAPQEYQAEFVRLKNISTSNYLHNQQGPVACTSIDFEWWSAQWEIVPAGNNLFQIRNRWKGNYLSAENNNVFLSDNGNIPAASWTIEETNTSNVYFIKQASTNARLMFRNGQLVTSSSYNSNDASAQWTIEK